MSDIDELKSRISWMEEDLADARAELRALEALTPPTPASPEPAPWAGLPRSTRASRAG